MFWRYFGTGAVVLLAAIQLVPVDRTNPPVGVELAAPEPIREVLQRACYDCHSAATRWPWYSYVAPVSWAVAHHVEEGREHLDFTQWDRYRAKKRGKLLEEAAEEVGEGEMPLLPYRLAHPEARLDAAERKALVEWFRAASKAADSAEALERAQRDGGGRGRR
jgi:hypothetical protein